MGSIDKILVALFACITLLSCGKNGGGVPIVEYGTGDVASAEQSYHEAGQGQTNSIVLTLSLKDGSILEITARTADPETRILATGRYEFDIEGDESDMTITGGYTPPGRAADRIAAGFMEVGRSADTSILMKADVRLSSGKTVRLIYSGAIRGSV